MKKNLIKIFFIFFLALCFLYVPRKKLHTPPPQFLVHDVSKIKKAIIIGASSGIGKALATTLSENGYEVGLTARRFELLEKIQQTLPGRSYLKKIDVSQPEEAMELLQELITEMGRIDLIILNAGVGYANKNLDWKKQQETINVNVCGFTALANQSLHYFLKQKTGHLVGISSIAASRGLPQAYTYCATKAYISTYLQGLRHALRLQNLPIYVTDIQPGFVDTDMIKNVKNKIWQCSAEEAAQKIFDAIQEKRDHAYITQRWGLIAWFMKYAPTWLFELVWKDKTVEEFNHEKQT